MTLPVGGVTGIGGVAAGPDVGERYALAAVLEQAVFSVYGLGTGIAQAVVDIDVYDVFCVIDQPVFEHFGLSVAVEQTLLDVYGMTAPLRFEVLAVAGNSAPIQQVQFSISSLAAPVQQSIFFNPYRRSAWLTQQIADVYGMAAPITCAVDHLPFDLAAQVELAVYEVLAALDVPVRHTVFEPQAVGGGAFVAQAMSASADITSWAVLVNIGNAAGDGEPLNAGTGAVMGALLGRLTGQMTVDAEEGAARIAEFSVLPEPGPIHINALTGLPITIYLVVSHIHLPIFQGILDIPGWDPVQGVLHLSCTDNLQNRFDGIKRKDIAKIIGGFWSEYVFDKKADEWQYLQDRLSTLPASYDLDLNLQGVVTPWRAKTAPDFTFTRDAVLENSIRIDMASARQLVNTIDVKMQYRYERLMQREVSIFWEMNLSELVAGGAAPSVETVFQAVDGTGWACYGLEMLPVPTGAFEGVGLLGDVPRYSLTVGLHCALAQRWTQTVTEDWSVTVDAPDSIQVIGKRKGSTTANFDSNADKDPRYTHWDRITERETKFTLAGQGTVSPIEGDTSFIPYHPLNIKQYTVATPDGARRLPSQDVFANPRGDLYYDLDDGVADNRAGLSNGYMTGIARAQRDILSSHRQTTLSFTGLIAPLLDRTHTVRMLSARLTAKGKVRRVTHNLDFDAGSALTEVAIAVSKAYGVGMVDTPYDLQAPAKPAVVQPPLKYPMERPSASYDSSTGEFMVTVPGVAQEHIDATHSAPADHVSIFIPDDELTLEA